MPIEDDAPITPRDLTDRGFYTAASVKHAIVPPALVHAALAVSTVEQESDGFWYFEARPICNNHILRIRPVPKTHFPESGGEHSAMKLVTRDLDTLELTSGRYGQIHVYFQAAPVDLCAWRFDQCIYVRRRFSLGEWHALSAGDRAEILTFQRHTHAF